MISDDDLRQQWHERRGQFASDAQVSDSLLRRLLWVSGGFVFIGLGTLGAFLPVLPTTVFVILAAACFARSSPRFYNRVLSHPVFGPLVYEWRERRTIPPRAKAWAVGLIVVTFTISIAFVVTPLFGRVVMVVVGLAVIVWLLSIPSGPDDL